MTLLPASIAGRFLTLLFASLLVLHLGSIGLYHLGLEAELDVTNEQRLAERLASVKRAIAHEAPAKREDLAHALSGGPLEIHWTESDFSPQRVDGSDDFSSLKRKLMAAAPELNEDGLVIRAAAALPEHASATRFLLVSMRLDDGTWVDVTATRNIEARTGLHQIALSTTVMVLGVIAVAAFLIRQITRSLRALADAANRLDPNAGSTPVEEGGPSEVRALSAAFNNLQRRVKRLVDDRTQTLAAISHDLKTPLTRMRLRTEDIADPELARSVTADLAEMEAMLDSTLAFLRGDQLSEEKKPIDLGSLLDTISSDLVDLGHDVTLTRSGPVVVRGRHLALKRAFRNLAENAVKYGVRARITLNARADGALVVIDDDGPGIPEDKKEAIFRPFYRIDDSRNRETGGVGLGLTVARSVIHSHGGELTLTNRGDGGLCTSVSLPA
jgi:two-component system OmpR family sensor kinase